MPPSSPLPPPGEPPATSPPARGLSPSPRGPAWTEVWAHPDRYPEAAARLQAAWAAPGTDSLAAIVARCSAGQEAAVARVLAGLPPPPALPALLGPEDQALVALIEHGDPAAARYLGGAGAAEAYQQAAAALRQCRGFQTSEGPVPLDEMPADEVAAWLHHQAGRRHQQAWAPAASGLWLPARGRPPGTGTFRDQAAFLAAVRPAVRQLQRQGRSPTAVRVRQALATRFGQVDSAQFTHWYQRLGWPTWAAVLAALAAEG